MSDPAVLQVQLFKGASYFSFPWPQLEGEETEDEEEAKESKADKKGDIALMIHQGISIIEPNVISKVTATIDVAEDIPGEGGRWFWTVQELAEWAPPTANIKH